MASTTVTGVVTLILTGVTLVIIFIGLDTRRKIKEIRKARWHAALDHERETYRRLKAEQEEMFANERYEIDEFFDELED